MKIINQILSILTAIIVGIGAAIIITKYATYVAFISIALIVAVASHIVIDNILHRKNE